MRELTHQLIEMTGDTAAVLECLERVVICDTSVGHLAGAMGKEAWVMLPFAPDWRWLLGRNDTPWYPTLRLFRQAKDRQWPPVMAAIAKELAAAPHSGYSARAAAAARRARQAQ